MKLTDMSNSLRSEIKWFHSNELQQFEHNELCQCGTEEVISRSSDPKRMRAFLLVSVFIDQLIFTHYHSLYQKFRDNYKIPKLIQHTSKSNASPSWFIFSRRGYDQKVDWVEIDRLAKNLLSDAQLWLRNNNQDSRLKLIEIVEEEIKNEFEPVHQPKLLYAFLR